MSTRSTLCSVDGVTREMTQEEIDAHPDYELPPDPPSPDAVRLAVSFEQENRIRALEGQPPLTMDEFKDRWANAI